ncbi:MAG: hypothetical protein IT233_13470 [Bacteroidia bacterium]|nr:hypothetical protein [Bacteroidia bacterium]
MKNTLTIIAVLFTCCLAAQNLNPQYQNPLPQQMQQQILNVNNNPVNNEDNNDRNVVNQQDWNEEQPQVNKEEQQEKPCPDCDKIKKSKRENYGNNYAGNYNGGAKKFKRRKTWKRICYNLSHRTGMKKSKSNYSVCFNW